MTAHIDTPLFYFIMEFGKDNTISILSKIKRRFRTFTFFNEDCLSKQLAYIFNGKNAKLHKLDFRYN
jgi:hypothetical protein